MKCKYYPTYWSGCNPIHEVTSWSLVRQLVRAAWRGEKIPPILIDGQLHNGNLLNGTHRAAANDILMMLAERHGTPMPLIAYEIYDADMASDELQKAVDACDYERIDDLLDRGTKYGQG